MMVFEQDRKDAVLHAMANDFTRKILLSTVAQARSVIEISVETGIPISTCYRRIRELLGLRLLRIDKTIITDDGKKYETFRSIIKDVKASISSEQISVEVTIIPREPVDEKLSLIHI